ncbi:hypothetical protein OS493_040062, partial [Desmophyllum pertusum]
GYRMPIWNWMSPSTLSAEKNQKILELERRETSKVYVATVGRPSLAASHLRHKRRAYLMMRKESTLEPGTAVLGCLFH